MKVFATNENNDLYLDARGRIAIKYDIEAVAQSCTHALKTIKGEIFLNIERGMPNFQTIWKGNPNLKQFEAAARDILLTVPNVKGVPQFVASFRDNTLFYETVIKTTYGDLNLNGNI